MEQVDDEKLLLPEEVAVRLEVPTSWVYGAARRGDLPCVRVGRYVRFRRPDVDAWIANGGKPVES